MTEEVWKDIPGYEGRYQASTEGRIRSLDRYVKRGTNGYWVKGKVLSGSLDSGGYKNVSLGYKTTKRRVHELIALTFLGPRPDGYDVCHKNGNRSDNKIENLRYDSKAENQIDVYRQKSKRYKLYAKDVIEIRKQLKSGKSQRDIAKAFGVNQSLVTAINARRAYSWLSEEFICSYL